MDWTEIIVGILSLLGVLLGGGGIVTIFMFREQDRKAKELENTNRELDNDDKASDAWRELYERSLADKNSVAARNAELESRIEERDTARESKISELTIELINKEKEISHRDVEIMKLHCFMCTKVNCTNRLPPFTELNEDTAD